MKSGILNLIQCTYDSCLINVAELFVENFIIFKLPTFCIYMGYFCHLNRNIAIICFKSFIAVHSHFGLYLFIAYFITKQAHYEKKIISTRSNNIERNIDMVISYINQPINIVLLKSYAAISDTTS